MLFRSAWCCVNRVIFGAYRSKKIQEDLLVLMESKRLYMAALSWVKSFGRLSGSIKSSAMIEWDEFVVDTMKEQQWNRCEIFDDFDRVIGVV